MKRIIKMLFIIILISAFAFFSNTFVDMLNEILEKASFTEILIIVIILLILNIKMEIKNNPYGGEYNSKKGKINFIKRIAKKMFFEVKSSVWLIITGVLMLLLAVFVISASNFTSSILLKIGPLAILLISFILYFVFMRSGKSKYKNKIDLKEASDEFNKLYEQVYRSYILELEEKRKKILKNGILILLCIFIPFLVLEPIIELTYFIDDDILQTLIWASIFITSYIFGTLLFVKVTQQYKEYRQIYKKEIFECFLGLIDNKQFNYSIGNNYGIANKYLEAYFDDVKLDKVEGDDVIEIRTGGIYFLTIGEVQVLEKMTDGYREVFGGLLANFNTCKDINTYIKVSKNSFWDTSNISNVQLDDSEFEKIFDVYSENKVMVARILTADIMRKLVDFYDRYNLQFDIVFSNSNVYIRFNTGRMFEPGIFKKSIEKSALFCYYSITKFVIELSQNINKVLEEIEM